eukprot:g6834.t1
MSGAEKPPELVEDPRHPQSSVQEDRSREERVHGSQEVGAAYNDADDTDDDLEICFGEEMDAMGSTSDNGSDDGDEFLDGGIEKRSPRMGELEKLEMTCVSNGLSEDANATLEWSHFMNSTEVDVMASIGESEVARRIKREKARCLEARQQRRKDSVARARHEESFVAFQAAWRGRRARAKAAPALSARRRESEERRQMFEEERLAEGVVALETERREMEAKLLMKELKDMRCEETRIRQAWLFLRRLEETARGEELVRMRAEERFTRALLDLELQDLRRLESARRETGETYRMRSEDHAMQDLMRLEEAQMAEREAMGVEDALAGIWKKNEECELAFSRAEESRMAVEDRSSSVWNAEYRRLQEARYRKAWARSTPIQRAMDPEGMAAVHSLGGVPLREGQASPREERGSPVERDGEECELTVDMLSHLGPLQDLTALELCVEGLTSAPLLKACTSLKSLSLNVNRLSSPSGLVVSTSLVRLGLRDNRLSSLEGLSGLPCLRELRLDINHVTSLHELKQLPALIELSANTNHIRELPEEFAADLMSPQDPLRTPDDIGSSLQACSELEEVRLHDNPASSSQQYADAVALSCPKLVRMDGVQLDTRVHWRAGANTYGARADLVLPFLLNTDESSDIHGTNEQTGNSGNGSKASSVVEIDETCPWCGTGRPSTEKKMASANDSTGGATILGTGDEGGGLERAARSMPGREDGTTRPVKEQAVMKLQSAFRGFHVRRALQAALESARYVDDEVEGLLNVNGGTAFELDLQDAREAEESFGSEDSSAIATDNAREESGGGVGSARADEKGLAQAWGLKDPSVARAMMRRAKRLRKFQNGEARREKMKNPDVRFEAFAKTAGEHRTARGAALVPPEAIMVAVSNPIDMVEVVVPGVTRRDHRPRAPD